MTDRVPSRALDHPKADAGPTPDPGSDAWSGGDHLRILSRSDWVVPVVGYLKKRAIDSGACDAETAERLVICAAEAITNAIVHGNYELDSWLKEEPGNAFADALAQRSADPTYAHRLVDIRVEYLPDRCVWSITDQGKGFDFGHWLGRLDRDEPDVSSASGRGIAIMRAFVDEVSWEHHGRTVRLAIHAKSGRERRTAERHRYVRPVAVIPADQPVGFSATCRNLSSTGLAAVAQHPVAHGTAVILRLELDRPRAVEVRGGVVRCYPLASGAYDLAVHFDRPLDIDPLIGRSHHGR